ncbi:hypothetical protein, partial [Pseudomonas sp. EKM23D]|uniref:hypothetical protein n=1 Tax=Pseudomonas sp. EKM23D TaxID=2708062 RepID=UPI001A9B7FCF
EGKDAAAQINVGRFAFSRQVLLDPAFPSCERRPGSRTVRPTSLATHNTTRSQYGSRYVFETGRYQG